MGQVGLQRGALRGGLGSLTPDGLWEVQGCPGEDRGLSVSPHCHKGQASPAQWDRALSFHLGSCSLEPQGFAQAVAEAQLAFDMGAELGYRMHLLDIGGGFPGTEDARAQFEEVHGSQGRQRARLELAPCPAPGIEAELMGLNIFSPSRSLP